MTHRETILGRIREALTVPTPKPHRNGDGLKAGLPTEKTTSTLSADDQIRAVLPAVGKTNEENLALFAKNAQGLCADFKVVDNLAQAVCVIRQIAQQENWNQVASHKGALTDAVCQQLGLPVFSTDAPFDKIEMEKCPVGISECDALVAQTGSVVVTSQSCGGRALSVLPPHHIVLARQDQLVPGLPEAFAMLRTRYGAAFPSMISFITGPSRTGDIERILVLGAHGPKKLTMLCLKSDK